MSEQVKDQVITDEQVEAAKLQAEQLKTMAISVVTTIGEGDAAIARTQLTTQQAVEMQLVDMRNAGFTVDMLESGHAIREAMVVAMQRVYVLNLPVNPKALKNAKKLPLITAAKAYADYYAETVAKGEVPEEPTESWFTAHTLPNVALAKQTIYNRMSAIKKWFKENDGTKSFPLDLYANAGREAAAENAKKGTGSTEQPKQDAPKVSDPVMTGQSHPADKQDEQKQEEPADVTTLTTGHITAETGSAPKAVQQKQVVNTKGIGPLRQFLEAWVVENESNKALATFVEASKIMLNQIEAASPKK